MDFFKKAKSLIIPKVDFEDQLNSTVNKLGDSFFEKLETVLEERKNDLNNSNLSQNQIDEVIKNYAQQNMMIAASAATAPGPLGVVAMVFEITGVVGNQLKMTYDIACAYDKEDLINRDLLIDIPLHAMGIETNLDQIQNASPTEMLESTPELLKEKATQLAKEIATKSAKKSLVKFIPVAGSILMAVWTKSNTRKVSNAAVYFFDKNKTLKVDKKPIEKIDHLLIEKLHLQALLNLMKADSLNSQEEIEFIAPMIEHSNLDEKSKTELMTSLHTDQFYSIDFQAFKNAPDEKEALITDLVILYKRDKVTHQNEIKYIQETGKTLGFELEYINDLLSEE
ncbi:MAG: hypothetical protein AB8H03_21420 [Saprospiraceae bacterium]